MAIVWAFFPSLLLGHHCAWVSACLNGCSICFFARSSSASPKCREAAECGPQPSSFFSSIIFSLGDFIKLHSFIYHRNLYTQSHSPGYQSLGYLISIPKLAQQIRTLDSPWPCPLLLNSSVLVNGNSLTSCSGYNSRHFPSFSLTSYVKAVSKSCWLDLQIKS